MKAPRMAIALLALAVTACTVAGSYEGDPPVAAEAGYEAAEEAVPTSTFFVSGAAPANGNLTGTLLLTKLYVTVPAGQRLRLKRCRAAASGNDLKAWVQAAGALEWTSTAYQFVDEAPDAILVDNSAGGAPASRVVSFGFRAMQGFEPYGRGDGIWAELAIE